MFRRFGRDSSTDVKQTQSFIMVDPWSVLLLRKSIATHLHTTPHSSICTISEENPSGNWAPGSADAHECQAHYKIPRTGWWWSMSVYEKRTQTLRLHPCAGRGRSNGKARESSLVASLGLETKQNITTKTDDFNAGSCMGSSGSFDIIRSFWVDNLIWVDQLIDHKPQDSTFGQRQEAPERAHHQAACLGRVEAKPKQNKSNSRS